MMKLLLLSSLIIAFIANWSIRALPTAYDPEYQPLGAHMNGGRVDNATFSPFSANIDSLEEKLNGLRMRNSNGASKNSRPKNTTGTKNHRSAYNNSYNTRANYDNYGNDYNTGYNSNKNAYNDNTRANYDNYGNDYNTGYNSNKNTYNDNTRANYDNYGNNAKDYNDNPYSGNTRANNDYYASNNNDYNDNSYNDNTRANNDYYASNNNDYNDDPYNDNSYNDNTRANNDYYASNNNDYNDNSYNDNTRANNDYHASNNNDYNDDPYNDNTRANYDNYGNDYNTDYNSNKNTYNDNTQANNDNYGNNARYYNDDPYNGTSQANYNYYAHKNQDYNDDPYSNTNNDNYHDYQKANNSQYYNSNDRFSDDNDGNGSKNTPEQNNDSEYRSKYYYYTDEEDPYESRKSNSTFGNTKDMENDQASSDGLYSSPTVEEVDEDDSDLETMYSNLKANLEKIGVPNDETTDSKYIEWALAQLGNLHRNHTFFLNSAYGLDTPYTAAEKYNVSLTSKTLDKINNALTKQNKPIISATALINGSLDFSDLRTDVGRLNYLKSMNYAEYPLSTKFTHKFYSEVISSVKKTPTYSGLSFYFVSPDSINWDHISLGATTNLSQCFNGTEADKDKTFYQIGTRLPGTGDFTSDARTPLIVVIDSTTNYYTGIFNEVPANRLNEMVLVEEGKDYQVSGAFLLQNRPMIFLRQTGKGYSAIRNY